MDRAPAAIVGVAIALTAASSAFALSRAIATDDPFPVVTVPAVTTTAPGATTTVPAGATTVATTVVGVTTTVGAAGATTTTVAAAAQVAVDISNFQFSPAELTIPVGTTVVWTNSDSAQHSVLASDGSFTSPPMAPGATFSFTFTQAGTFGYICGFHPSMSATITVTG